MHRNKELGGINLNFVGTFWALLPPIIAISLALITKEVYISLFIGILSGALLYSDFSFMGTIETVFSVLIEKVGDSWNVGIVIFLVFLGIIVALMNKAGGSAAYGKYASSRIKTKRGAMLATFGLGALIFVDDYFNCLTVGSVMRPVTDKFNISRAKLAYIIDATAAPICIIAPISSWAAAVTGYTSGNGFTLFLQTIPYNLYAWLTIIMVVVIATTQKDFGSMKQHELAAEKGDLFNNNKDYQETETQEVAKNGKVVDLVIPIVSLIAFCVIGLIYTGGFFSGEGISFIDAFASSNASMGLVLGSFFALVVTFVLYLARRVMSYKEFADCFPVGFKMMVPPILILSLAWTLGGICRDYLQAGLFVNTMLDGASMVAGVFPAVLFLIALGLAFSTGTSWGTFGILIPIITDVFAEGSSLLVISIAAILAGAVCGDHISPISDTTIMASAGAQCNHVTHVSTQIPYALTVAVCCFVGYIIAGFTQNIFITMAAGLFMLAVCLFVILGKGKKKNST